MSYLGKCFVCGSELPQTDHRCPVCNNGYTAVTCFANENTYICWLQQMQQLKREYEFARLEKLRKNEIGIFPNDEIYYLDGIQNKLYIVMPDGEVKIVEDVAQYSASSLHSVILKKDGTVYAYGNNDDFQCSVSEMNGVSSVFAGPKCTYAVNNDGDISVAGFSPIEKSVKNCHNVLKIVGENNRMVSLDKAGNVRIIEENVRENRVVAIDKSGKVNVIEENTRNNIIDIESDALDIKTTFNFTVWLNKDGTVGYYAKNESDKRATDISSWKDIIAIGLTFDYAVGLTKGGKVLLSGNSTSEYDVSDWERIALIGCSSLGIVALQENGIIKSAGLVDNDMLQTLQARIDQERCGE